MEIRVQLSVKGYDKLIGGMTLVEITGFLQFVSARLTSTTFLKIDRDCNMFTFQIPVTDRNLCSTSIFLMCICSFSVTKS